MIDQRDERPADLDDLLKEIGAGLAIDPSPAFAARVRGAVDETDRPPRWAARLAWVGGLGVAAVLAVAFAMTMVAPRMAGRPQESAAASSPAAARSEAAAAGSEATTADAVGPRVAPSGAQNGRIATAHSRGPMPAPPAPAPASAPAPAESASAGPDLVVLTNQPGLLRRMWASGDSGAIVTVANGASSPFEQLSVTSVSGEITIAELAIPPIVIPEIIGPVMPATGAGGSEVKRIVGAEHSARSRE
jgi:hypothetical protein